ncbi:MAG: dehydrogenase/reductase SDR family protein 12 [Glaciecola sp.]|jgi:dehydrogenase/reductase SDR family protein 12|uniref:SDR family NAD(P)-dependent oxidoreductase n=1 Tax=Congregibacter sp. TaxID=2744308 RepID=UPI0039E65A82
MTASDLAKILGFYGRFTPTYSRIGYWGRRTQWTRSKRDFTGQNWLVTGASGGIGAAIVAGAAEAGATVIAVARSEDKLAQARASLSPEAAARVESRICDLSSVASIATLLASLRDDGRRIDVLQNNVGVLFNELEMTGEGFETTYVINLLGQYQLTEGLIDAGLLGEKPLIVNMASGGLYNVPQNTKLLNVTDAKRYGGKVAYASHKRGQVVLSGLWNERLKPMGGHSYVLHPGWARTEGVQKALPTFYKIQGAILRSPAEGADTALWLAAERPSAAGRSIWFDRAVRPEHVFPHTHSAKCTDEDLVAFLKQDLSKAIASE